MLNLTKMAIALDLKQFMNLLTCLIRQNINISVFQEAIMRNRDCDVITVSWIYINARMDWMKSSFINVLF